MNDYNEIISNIDSSLVQTDPELTEILDNFFSKQVLKHSSLSVHDRLIVTIACLVANQSIELYENFVPISLDMGVTPVEIKEVLYQSLAYIGLSKMYVFLKKTNELFSSFNIILPLDNQTIIDYEDRLESGYNLQVRNFGKEFIDKNIKDCPSDQKHLWDFISSYAFGDFYTRTGLDDNIRELISFTFILSLRGCENQLKIHTKGNIKIGNSREKLVSVITVLIPYIGFPRAHNALAILNEVCEELGV